MSRGAFCIDIENCSSAISRVMISGKGFLLGWVLFRDFRYCFGLVWFSVHFLVWVWFSGLGLVFGLDSVISFSRLDLSGFHGFVHFR